MRPLFLHLQAFGPFSGSELIDFTLLGPNPLFLINGPTGAGKSSILDALCFALYGQTTGNEREAAQMRCDYADAQLLTEVIFTFALGNKQYRIRRVPLQERAKARGEGTTTQQPEAQLWFIDSAQQEMLLVAKSVADATVQIRELLGLSVEQFRQVMVLPQGQFRELLMADSKEREKIFSQLFQTHIYQKIEENLKAKAAAIRQNMMAHHHHIKGLLDSIDVTSRADLNNHLLEIQPLCQQAEQAKQAAAKNKLASTQAYDAGQALLKRFLLLRQTRLKFAELQAADASIDQQQQRLQNNIKAQKIYPIQQEVFKQEQQLLACAQERDQALLVQQRAEDAFVKAQQTQRQALEQAQCIDLLQQELADLFRYQTLADDWRRTCDRADQLYKDWQMAQTDKATAQAQKNKIEQDFIRQQTQQQELEFALADFANQQVVLHQLTIQLDSRKQLEQLREQYKILATHKNEANALVQNQKQAFTQAEQTRKKIEWRWHSGQAALLAQQLQPGEPCLVCGSLDHPQPAQATVDLVTMEQVESARERENAARAQLHDAAIKAASAERDIDEHQREGKKFAEQLGKLAEWSLAAVHEQYCAAAAQVKAMQTQQSLLTALLTAMAAAQQTIQQLVREVQLLDERENKSQQEYTVALARKLLLEEQLPELYRRSDGLSTAVEQHQKTLEQLKEQLAKANQSLETARSEVDRASAVYQTKNRYWQQHAMTLTAAKNHWALTLQSSAFVTEEAFVAALLSDHEIHTLTAQIAHHREIFAQTQGALQPLENELANLPEPDLLALQLVQKNHQQQYEQAEQEWLALDRRRQQLIDVNEKLNQADKTNAELNQQYAIYGTLSDVANGQTGNKISLQRFVLSVLLDDVLIQASQRLQIMSKGRYQLVRKEDRTKGNKASGLELEVDDGYTGKTRAVATLSGGEAFMAALALALGLADVVQSYAGGVRLDTLFIDEGFGSLDAESLDLAIRTLMDLQASGRTIGIISHVSELKEQMALRLDVVRSRMGSRVRVVA